MANEEALTIDGLAVNDGVTFGMVEFSAPVPRQRQDWVGAADSEAQLLVRNPLHENRKITAKIVVSQQASMNAAHDKLLLVLDKLQKASRYTDGIAMTWTPATGTRTATFDVLAGEIVDLPIDWENGWLARSPTFTIEMTCKPYWRGTETLTSTASSSSPFVTLEVAGVTGDVPALGRLIVTDTASQSRRHVEWGLEGPLTYNASTGLLLDSDSLVTSGFGGSQTTRSGAYDPNVTGNNAITAELYSASIAVCGTGNQSHVGTFRVKARVQSTNGSFTHVRLAWKAGDGPMTSNAWVSPGSANQWWELDLGTITVPAATVGSQRWTGQLEAYDDGAAALYVDYLVLVPAGDGYGKARAQYSSSPGVIVGRDEFTGTTAGGALNGRVTPAGGTWATSGDTTDFVFGDNVSYGTEFATRSVPSAAGRFALLGTSTPTDVQVSVTLATGFWSTTIGTSFDMAVVARYVNATNYLYATYRRATAGAGSAVVLTQTLEIRQVVAGVETLIAASTSVSPVLQPDAFIDLVAYSTGTVRATLRGADFHGGSIFGVIREVSGSSSALATGGALASGKSGLLDRHGGSNTFTRQYDNFTVATPAPEPIVLYSGRNMQIRHDDVLRQDSTGTYSGRPPSYRGSRFLVPVGTSRIMVKARRADIEAAVDDNVTDATQVQVGWTARGLAVPR